MSTMQVWLSFTLTIAISAGVAYLTSFFYFKRIKRISLDKKPQPVSQIEKTDDVGEYQDVYSTSSTKLDAYVVRSKEIVDEFG